MADIDRLENYADLVIRSLAELADRLRRSLPGSAGESPVPVCISRLEVSAALFNNLVLPPPADSLQGLGGALYGLLAAMEDAPAGTPGFLEPVLLDLAEVLESILRRLDEGETSAQLARDPAWLQILSRLESAGTPLEIMDELDASARRWEDRWCEDDLSPALEQELRRRWRTFRDYGDAMFQSPAVPAGPEARARVPVVLLIESVLHREQLLRKLARLGFAVRTAASPEEALGMIGRPEPTSFLFCDNLEPSNHLLRLVQGTRQERDLPVLVLVTAGSGNPRADLQRARQLGAAGVWIEPFDRGSLSGIPVPGPGDH